MSTDNEIVIFQDEDGKFRGYHNFISAELTDDEIVDKEEPLFVVRTADEAVDRAAEECTEYGTRFVIDDAELAKEEKKMRADNEIIIFADLDGKYRGYAGSLYKEVDDNELRDKYNDGPLFMVSSAAEAIRHAENENMEYGYRFITLKQPLYEDAGEKEEDDTDLRSSALEFNELKEEAEEIIDEDAFHHIPGKRPAQINIRIEKEGTFHAAHQLPKHKGKCKALHGHSWRYRVTCKGTEEELKDGVLVDFGTIKDLIEGELDHGMLNDLFLNPTAENIARSILLRVPKAEVVELWESSNNKVTVTWL